MKVYELMDVYQDDIIITKNDEFGEEVVLCDSRTNNDVPFDLYMAEINQIWSMEFLINVNIK